MRQILWRIAPLIGWLFAHMSFAIPARRLYETDTLMAFHHPKPSYPFHVLIVPKQAITTLMDLDAKNATLLSDIYVAAQQLVNDHRLTAYRLIVNGGDYQDFPQLHFHLISDAVTPPSKA